MKATSYKDRIKVAFVVRNLEYVGGTEKFILSFINFALAKKDIELGIFCLEGTGKEYGFMIFPLLAGVIFIQLTS